MQTYQRSLHDHFEHLLAHREDELRAALDVVEHGLDPAAHDVTDFKDLAGEQSTAELDDRQAQRLHEALRQVAAARQRLTAGRYGECLDCGQALDLRRLTALPEAGLCSSCQAARELAHPAAASGVQDAES